MRTLRHWKGDMYMTSADRLKNTVSLWVTLTEPTTQAERRVIVTMGVLEAKRWGGQLVKAAEGLITDSINEGGK